MTFEQPKLSRSQRAADAVTEFCGSWLKITLGLSLLVGTCCGQQRLAFKGDGGETIYFRVSGKCESGNTGMDSHFIRTHHYEAGRVYGIKLFTGELVPPGQLPKHPDRVRVVWMCRYHIAEWIGIDPKTGRRRDW